MNFKFLLIYFLYFKFEIEHKYLYLLNYIIIY